MKKSYHFLIGLVLSGFTIPAIAQQKPITEDFYEGLEWRNIGPNRGGRSLGCAGSPDRPNEYYFWATGGGLWKTPKGDNE